MLEMIKFKITLKSIPAKLTHFYTPQTYTLPLFILKNNFKRNNIHKKPSHTNNSNKNHQTLTIRMKNHYTNNFYKNHHILTILIKNYHTNICMHKYT